MCRGGRRLDSRFTRRKRCRDASSRRRRVHAESARCMQEEETRALPRERSADAPYSVHGPAVSTARISIGKGSCCVRDQRRTVSGIAAGLISLRQAEGKDGERKSVAARESARSGKLVQDQAPPCPAGYSTEGGEGERREGGASGCWLNRCKERRERVRRAAAVLEADANLLARVAAHGGRRAVAVRGRRRRGTTRCRQDSSVCASFGSAHCKTNAGGTYSAKKRQGTGDASYVQQLRSDPPQAQFLNGPFT